MAVTFQSRFGREEWLQPYTDKTLEKLAKDKVTSVDLFCPGFSSDCAETLEEIDMLNREVFLTAGGERFHYIPALNDDASHIEAIANIALQHMQGWQQAGENFDPDLLVREKMITQERAIKLGASK